MMEVRKQDKLFVAVVVPLALIGAYFYWWRMPLAARATQLGVTYARLPDPATFPMEKRALEHRLADAEKELAAIKAEKPAEPLVVGGASDDVARRQEAFVKLLRDEGVRICSIAPQESAPETEGSSSRGAAVLRATGVRPEPVVRRVVVEAPYAVWEKALRVLSARRQAVVLEGVSLQVAETDCRWEMTVWL